MSIQHQQTRSFWMNKNLNWIALQIRSDQKVRKWLLWFEYVAFGFYPSLLQLIFIALDASPPRQKSVCMFLSDVCAGKGERFRLLACSFSLIYQDPVQLPLLSGAYKWLADIWHLPASCIMGNGDPVWKCTEHAAWPVNDQQFHVSWELSSVTPEMDYGNTRFPQELELAPSEDGLLQYFRKN